MSALKAVPEATRFTPEQPDPKSLIPPQGPPLASVQIALTIQDSQFVLLNTYDVRPTQRAFDSAESCSRDVRSDHRSRARLSEREAMWSEEDEDEGASDDSDSRRGRSEDGEGEDEGLVALACSDQDDDWESRSRGTSVETARSAANMVYGARCALVLRVTSTLNLFLALRALQPDPPDAPVLREPPWPLEVSLSKYEYCSSH